MKVTLVMALLATAVIVPSARATATTPDKNIESCSSSLASQDYEGAVAIGRLAVTSSPKNTQSYFCLGSALVHKGEYNEAIVILRKAESLTKNKGMRAAIASFLGSSYSHIGNGEEALRQHNRALQLRIETEDTVGMAEELNDIANEYQYTGEWEKAMDYYRRSLEIVPDPVTFINIGTLYGKMGRYDEAGVFIRKGLDLHQRAGDYHAQAIAIINLGAVQAHQGDLKEAEVTLRDGLGKIRNVGDVYWEGVALQLLGSVYGEAGLKGDALEQYQKAVAIFSRMGAADKVAQIEEDIDLLDQPSEPEAAEVNSGTQVF